METKSLHLVIVSPEKTLFKGVVTDVTLPGSQGIFMVLPKHAPLISSLEKGTLTYTTAEGEQSLEITGGFVEVRKNEVSVCVEQ
mgnify:FL=1